MSVWKEEERDHNKKNYNNRNRPRNSTDRAEDMSIRTTAVNIFQSVGGKDE